LFTLSSAGEVTVEEGSRAARLRRAVARVALVMTAFGAFAGLAPANIGLSLLLLLLLSAPGELARLVAARDPLLWLTAAFLIYLIVRSAAMSAPVGADWDAVWKWVRIGPLPILLAVMALAQVPELGRWLPLVLVAGLLARIGRGLDAELLVHLLDGSARAGFGNSPTFFGQYALVAQLGLLFMVPTLERLQMRGRWRALLWLAWSGAFLVCALALVVSQTRAAVIAAVLLLPAAWLSLHWYQRWRRKSVLAAAVVLLMVGGIMLGGASKHLLERFAVEQGVVALMVEGRWEDIPPTSFGLRVHMWREAVDTWKERPLFGWGPGSAPGLLQQSAFPPLVSGGFVHHHNTYLGVLVELGLVGFALMSMLFALLLRESLCRREEESIGYAGRKFVFWTLAVLLLAGMTDHVLLADRVPFLLAIVGAMVYQPCLRAGQMRGQD
jgi:O-antigen ligase